MRKRIKKYPLYEKVKVIDVAGEGKSLAKVRVNKTDRSDMIIFVNGAIPGDVVDIKINKVKSNFQEGNAIHFHEYSKDRIKPVCQHFGTCGGCKWQQLPYDKQLYYKQKQVVDNLERIGKVKIPKIQNIIPAQSSEFYRNKLEFAFSDDRWIEAHEENVPKDDLNALGFHIPGRFDKILDIKKCYLQRAPSNDIRLTLKEFAIENKISFFNVRSEEGLLRNVMIRTSTTGEIMVVVSFFYNDSESIKKVMNHIGRSFPEVTSLMYVINPKKNDSMADLDVLPYKGNNHIFEEMEGLKFKIGPKSFYQTNSEQAFNLYKLVREYAKLTGEETIYDLYTGTGTIANFIAKNAKKVIGIDYIPESIEDAKVNSKINNITNAHFFAGDMKDILTKQFIEKHGEPDVIITDPPRSGMHPNVVKTITFAEPEKIIYVSCNPATQARDLAMITFMYRIVKVQPVDMFPHTHHVENIVVLERK